MIFTLDARGNVFLDVITSYFNLTFNELYQQINSSFEDFIDNLNRININYKELKNALIPNTTKHEVALVFDSRKVGDNSYGATIFNSLIPLIDKIGSCSILCGDLIGNDSIRAFIRDEFLDRINTKVKIDYEYHDLFFIVYLNNLSEAQIEFLDKGLEDFPAYVGYFNMTYSSPLKSYLSTILLNHFIKYDNFILTPNEETISGFNVYGYSFEEIGYQCNTVKDIYYGLFLSFKIERETLSSIDSDNQFSLNSITNNVLNIDDFELVIEDKKLSYLLNAKSGSMERSGFNFMDICQLQKVIKSKLKQNYFYNMEYIKAYNVLKFNINIETQRTDKNAPMKMIVSLEYKPENKILRLITMY